MVEKAWRPPDYQERILANWRRMVRPEDRVIHLGDVIIGKIGTLKETLDSLPGTKFLVRGNHDYESDEWYMKRGFAFTGQGLLFGGVWFSHAPALVLPSNAVLNVHGHLHDGEHHGTNIPDHCKLLALEHTNYEPVLFEHIAGFKPRQLVISENYF
jgi:calcineurin-like phosphoesterase family protein